MTAAHARTSATLTAALCVVVLAACAEPTLPDGAEDEAATGQPLEIEELDPGREALAAEVAALIATVEAAREALDAGREADDVAAARSAGQAAVGLLVHDPQLGTPPAGGLDPLLPAESGDRGEVGEDGSRLTTTLTVSREAGEVGRRVADALGDPIAGDLGAWQRDAAGMVELVRSTAEPGAALEELEAAVLELPGEATRALAWAFLLADAPDREAAAAYAERGVAHLDVVLSVLAELDVEPAAGEGA